MHVTTRSAIGVLSAATLAGSAIGGVSAFGHNDNSQGNQGNHGRHNGVTVFRSSVAPSMPAPASPTIHAVNPGGAPWVLRSGEIRLRRGGRFQVRVRGLVIPNPPGDNTPGPVSTISASLYCGADTETTAAATTSQVPLSKSGNARIDQHVTLPSTCEAPIVLVHPNGLDGLYIASSGWRL
jgi:hypothetical protein